MVIYSLSAECLKPPTTDNPFWQHLFDNISLMKYNIFKKTYFFKFRRSQNNIRRFFKKYF